MCHPGRIGGENFSNEPVPVWARLFGGLIFLVMAIGFVAGGWILIGGRYLVRKCK